MATSEPRSRSTATPPDRRWFLLGVFLITFSVLVFQVVQTRILSVIAWYYLAFFAISVAMLGMTGGAVWVYLDRGRWKQSELSTRLAEWALRAAVAMPVSLLLQFSLITTLTPTLTSVFAWTLLMGAMTVPYVFSGVAVSMALTRSPFPVSQVYGVDLLGAALGCAAVVGILNVLDGPSAILFASLAAALASYAFSDVENAAAQRQTARRMRWRPLAVAVVLAALIPANMWLPGGLKPVMVKDQLETGWGARTERWNSYSRIVAVPP